MSGDRPRPEPKHPLDYLFYPRSVAVVGNLSRPGSAGRLYYLGPLLELGYQGRVYAVDTKGQEVAGARTYRSVKEIPGPVDLVIGCLPAKRTPDLVAECRDAGVKVVQIFSAGFAEMGEPEGKELQRQLKDVIRSDRPRVVGPNCMGVYCPESRISFCADYPRDPGPIGLICQSGGIAGCIVRAATDRGLRFSKVVSFGNAVDVDECDLLEYLAHDPETRIIAAYLEGTRNGTRFMDALRTAASAKPVVILKGGVTNGGSRATASHTGALAGSDAVWDGIFRQTGAIRIHSIEEMVDVLVALWRMKPPRGTNTCLAGSGGGPSVLSTDECEREGLRMVPMPEEVRKRVAGILLATGFPLAGNMVGNPIDATGLGGPVVSATGDASEILHYPWETVFKRGDTGWGDLTAALHKWPGLNLVIFHCPIDNLPLPITEAMIAVQISRIAAAVQLCRLPAAMVVHFAANESSRRLSYRSRQECDARGIPLFTSVGSAALAIRRLMQFNRTYPGILAEVRICHCDGLLI